ncbi:MAG: IS1634 family transposase [Deltaproteobacteria bacterium]|jgi:transposase|nr:IS1634 family transposase [Deltaproteobacteria bacterium]
MAYIEIFENKNKQPRVLLRESVRDGDKVRKITHANLSNLSIEQVKAFANILKGKNMIPEEEVIEKIKCEDTIPSGHVEAVMTAMNRIDLPRMINHISCPERNIILGLVASRILLPKSKLFTTEFWKTNSLAETLNLYSYDEHDVYKAMDWLYSRQPDIERRLAGRHLNEGDMVFLDVSSSYYEGVKSTLINHSKVESLEDESDDNLSPLIKFGYSRDKKRGKPQINYSLLTDKEGRPISIAAYPGNTADSTVFMPTVKKIIDDFGISRVVMVGDRGMISNKDITILRQTDSVDWLTALRSTSIKKLVPVEGFRLGLFDEKNIFEFTAPDEFPGERLIACRNLDLMAKRRNSRESLLKSTTEKLDKIKFRVEAGRLKDKEAIDSAIAKVINKNKMKKHIHTDTKEGFFNYSLKKESIEAEKALDGIYVIRTSLPVETLSTEDCVRQYKNLSQVEKAFRTMKTVDLKIRPIFHYLDHRIRCHLFLTMLAYYVEWHMREAWRELTFGDPHLAESKKTRDPVAPAKKSAETEFKERNRKTSDDPCLKIHSFDFILLSLASISEVKLVLKIGSLIKDDIYFDRRKEYNPLQKLALKLVGKIPRYPRR